jgi:hypothetical protein
VLRARDFASGVEARRDTGAPPVRAAEGSVAGTSIGYAPDAWLVTEQTDTEVRVASFAAADLAPRWTRVFPAGDRGFGDMAVSGYAWGCGPVVCLATPAQGVAVLDPADGHLLREANVVTLSATPSVWQIVHTAFRDDGRTSTFLNVLTGQRPYPSWDHVREIGEGTGRHLMRRDFDDRIAWGVFDEATGELTSIGATPKSRDHCGYAPPHLVCIDIEGTGTGGVRVWRMRGLPDRG